MAILIGFAVGELSYGNFHQKKTEGQYNERLLDRLIGFRDGRLGLAFDGSRIDLTSRCFGQARQQLMVEFRTRYFAAQIIGKRIPDGRERDWPAISILRDIDSVVAGLRDW